MKYPVMFLAADLVLLTKTDLASTCPASRWPGAGRTWSGWPRAGSHVVLDTDEPSRHRISILDHKALRIGTLNGILHAVGDHKGADVNEIFEGTQ